LQNPLQPWIWQVMAMVRSLALMTTSISDWESVHRTGTGYVPAQQGWQAIRLPRSGRYSGPEEDGQQPGHPPSGSARSGYGHQPLQLPGAVRDVVPVLVCS
jgi:hypothetical protein